MADIVEWEWRSLDPAEHPSLEAKELHGVYALGELWALAALVDDGDGPSWSYYNAPDPEDAWNGYECIDGYKGLDDVKAAIDDGREEALKFIRERDTD